MKRIFHDIDQNSDEWFELRLGKITASSFPIIMANYGSKFGNPAIELAMKIALESVTKRRIETFKNDWMLRGSELEESARQAYSDMTFTDVKLGGFYEYGRFGASPDGLIEGGLIEIKCPKFTGHMERLMKKGYNTAYQWQIRGQMWVTDRDFTDYVDFCPDFPADKQLYIFRVERDMEEEAKMEVRLSEFVELVDKYIKLL